MKRLSFAAARPAAVSLPKVFSARTLSARILPRRIAAPLHAAQLDVAADVPSLTGEDFYSILRCSPAATKTEVKSAWISRMREFHPDHAVTGSVDDANLLCSLLNEIFEVGTGWLTNAIASYKP